MHPISHSSALRGVQMNTGELPQSAEAREFGPAHGANAFTAAPSPGVWSGPVNTPADLALAHGSTAPQVAVTPAPAHAQLGLAPVQNAPMQRVSNNRATSCDAIGVSQCMSVLSECFDCCVECAKCLG